MSGKLRLIVERIRGNRVLDAGAKALLGLGPAATW